MSRPPISPGRAHVTAKAFELRVKRIVKHSNPALRSLHDNQPGYPSSGCDGSRSGGGHSDPTGDLAFSDDPARAVLEEVTHLFHTIDHATIRLDHLLRNWAGPSTKWREALATEAASKLNDEHNWCQAHARAGIMEPARTKDGRLCHRCEKDRATLGADPDERWLNTGLIRRHNTKDVREFKQRRKSKKR